MKPVAHAIEILDQDADEVLESLQFFTPYGREKKAIKPKRKVAYCSCNWAFKAAGRKPSGKSAGVPTEVRQDDASICKHCGYYVYTVLEDVV